MEHDDQFQVFAKTLENEIARYGGIDEETLLQRQQEQMEGLVALENDFRRVLRFHRYGTAVYREFLAFICDKKRNILAARPYFRERQDVFAAQISVALKNRDVKELQKFHFNYQFVAFVLKARKWNQGSEIVKIADKIIALRQEIVTLNMPLAISRANIFWRRTPRSHLSRMDLIQICCEGLLSAIDKFCLPFSKVFRGVAIGRMTGNEIESYSETLLHFYPSDKRKIYRANKVVSKFSEKFSEGVDFDKLADCVNSAGTDHQTTAPEISRLMSAASCVSADTRANEDDLTVHSVRHMVAPAEGRPDVIAEREEAHSALFTALPKLSILKRKLLRIKGMIPEQEKT